MTSDNILAPVSALSLPDAAQLTGRAQQALAFIDGFVIDGPEAYGLAGEELQAIKRRAKEIEAQRTGITGPLNQVLKAVNDLFRTPTDTLGKAEAALKGKMLAWQQDQERIAAEARRKAEEAAAAERRRLEEEAAAAQREAQAQAAAAAAAERAQLQALAAAEAAKAAGNAEAAAAAQREAQAQAQAAALAQSATDRAQAEAQSAAFEAQVITAPVALVAPTKAAGISTSKKLDFEVTDLHALVKHVAAHPELIAMLRADDVRLRAYVKGLGMACSLPGVRVFETSVMSARAA